MKYEAAKEYLRELNKRGIKPGLEGINLLLGALGNPEKSLNAIHVVGTNGKGSVSTYISNILRASGLKVGTYSSPAVFNDREIIKVNGRDITKEAYASLTEKIKEQNTMGCTRFEVETVMALMYFKDMECDVVVLEAGMGGMLDATNVGTNDYMTVFTSIGLDHTAFLGSNVTEIAKNKAGILKSGAVAVSAVQCAEAMAEIEKAAKDKESHLFTVDEASIKNIKHKADGTVFDYKDLSKIKISMMGTFQSKNAALAIEAVRALNEKGIRVLETAIRKGLEKSFLPGRFECVSKKPLIYLDGAHNEPASYVLRDTLLSCFTKKKFIYIMGMLKDKDVETVVKNTVDLASCIFTTATPNRDRTMSAFELADIVRKYNKNVSSMDGVEEAMELAIALADKDTVIVVFGSLSHLAKAKGAVAGSIKTSKKVTV